MRVGFDYDVFVSYSSTDAEIVSELAQRFGFDIDPDARVGADLDSVIPHAGR